MTHLSSCTWAHWVWTTFRGWIQGSLGLRRGESMNICNTCFESNSDDCIHTWSVYPVIPFQCAPHEHMQSHNTYEKLLWIFITIWDLSWLESVEKLTPLLQFWMVEENSFNRTDCRKWQCAFAMHIHWESGTWGCNVGGHSLLARMESSCKCMSIATVGASLGNCSACKVCWSELGKYMAVGSAYQLHFPWYPVQRGPPIPDIGTSQRIQVFCECPHTTALIREIPENSFWVPISVIFLGSKAGQS